MTRGILALLSVAFATCGEGSVPDIDELRQADYSATLVRERNLDETAKYCAYLVSYRVSGLKVYAMVASPKQPMPEGGYPVIVANHGYHPDPARYGITAAGIDSRPGDYYRSVPALFTSRGFLVILPDYRGHNSSEGLEFTEGDDAPAYYAEDVLALLSALGDIPEADTGKVFMWGHSMGAAVSIRVLLATDVVKGATLWSMAPVDDLADWIGDLQVPVQLHHAEADATAESSNSGWLVDALSASARPPRYFRYPGDSHFFDEELRERAADRDVEFFRGVEAPP